MNKKKIILHTCCAPCLGYVGKILEPEYDISVFYYNPNIAPSNEYHKRYNELENFCLQKKYALFKGAYNAREWTSAVKQCRFKGEKSERCWKCYELRLAESFKFACTNEIDLVGTTLSISPHKDAERMNEIGYDLSKYYGISFLEADFKQNNGFMHSLEISREHGFYRQNYCGCIYSKIERNKKSIWYKKFIKKNSDQL